jgi:hypothetical protein
VRRLPSSFALAHVRQRGVALRLHEANPVASGVTAARELI